MDHCRKHPGLRTSLWCRCKEEDIFTAAALSPDRLSLSIPVSDLHLDRKFGKNRSWAEQTMQSAIRLALKKGMEVSVGFEDATRADPDFLAGMARLAEEEGAFRIRLADTVGIAAPMQIMSMVHDIKKSLHTCEVAIHTHNDFGMATANALAALDAGASWADVTILGLGERSGCARLEELAGFLGIMRSSSLINPAHLKPLAGYVAEITNIKIDDRRPIIGDGIFTCETGLHLHGLQKDPTTYEPYPPERIGSKRRLIIGAKSGRNAVKTRLAELGYEIEDGLLLQTTRALRDKTCFFDGKPDELLADSLLMKTIRRLSASVYPVP
jgi:homocitrate synthase NifV